MGNPGVGELKGQRREERERARALVRGSKRPPPDGLGLLREVRGPQQEGRCGAEWEAWKDTVLESPAESERARAAEGSGALPLGDV